jgi:nuclear transport factor 2 (NTF2) superfamily protein
LNLLDLEYFYRVWNKEVDFIQIKDIYSLKPDLIGLEIKYKSKIKKEDTKWLKHFNNKYNLSKQIIISKDFSWNIWKIKIKPFF